VEVLWINPQKLLAPQDDKLSCETTQGRIVLTLWASTQRRRPRWRWCQQRYSLLSRLFLYISIVLRYYTPVISTEIAWLVVLLFWSHFKWPLYYHNTNPAVTAVVSELKRFVRFFTGFTVELATNRGGVAKIGNFSYIYTVSQKNTW